MSQTILCIMETKNFFGTGGPDPVMAILLLAVFMLLSGIGGDTYTFQYSDLFMVIPAWLPAIVLGFHWLIYKASRHLLYKNSLIWLHYALLAVAYVLLYIGKPVVAHMATFYVMVLLMLGFLVFTLNIILGRFAKKAIG